jgi:hypothetical protein
VRIRRKGHGQASVGGLSPGRFSQDGCVEFEITFTDGPGPADIEMAVSGVPTLKGLRLLNERLVSDLRFRAGLSILVDLGALDTSALSADAMQSLSESMAERDRFYPPAASAIIAPDESTHNSARTFRAHLGGSMSNRQVFRSRAEAVAWLEEQDRN